MSYDPELEASLTGNSKTFPLKTAYSNGLCYIPLGRYYGDESIAWQLFDASDHMPMGKATVSLIAYGLKPDKDHVFIKDYAENQGMYEGLKIAGVIGEHTEGHPVELVMRDVYHCPINYDKLVG